jgi:glutamyl/glutaminyl-tRNA synthetase
MGFLPQGLLNGLALLGWGDNMPKPVFDLNELIKKFSINKVNKKGAIFDIDKLTWINGQHLSRMDASEIWPYVKPLWQKASWIDTGFPDEKGIIYTDLLKARMHLLNDFQDYAGYLFRDPENYDRDAVYKHLQLPDIQYYLNDLLGSLETCRDFSSGAIEDCLRACANRHEIPAAALIHPLRLALTGFAVSPDLFTIAGLLGKSVLIRRLKNLIRRFSPKPD